MRRSDERPEHALDVPVFGAAVPPKMHHPRVPDPLWPWFKHVEICRSRPGEEAVVALYLKGTRDAIKREVNRDSNSLRKGLDRRFPLETWMVSVRMIPETWYQRALVLRFDGYMTEEEAGERRRAASAAYARYREKAQENRVQRGLRAQAQAMAEAEEKRQAAIRARSERPH